MVVTIPANGGVLNLTSQIQLETPPGGGGSTVLLLQTLDGTCGPGSAVTTSGRTDLVNSVYEVVPLSAAGTVSAGTHTIRTCAYPSHIYWSEKTWVKVSKITALWTPTSMGNSSFDASSVSTGEVSDLVSDMEARIAAMQDPLSKRTDG